MSNTVQWKMSFNPDPSKQAQKIIFSRKIKKLSHPSLVFNNNNVLQASSQKHLGVALDFPFPAGSGHMCAFFMLLHLMSLSSNHNRLSLLSLSTFFNF